MRKPIIAGNWKLNNTSKEALDLVSALKAGLKDVDSVDIVVCPVFTALSAVAQAVKGSNIALGAQNIYWEDSGAFTGEVSGPLLKAEGAVYVIIGHSERRQFFHETDESVNKRIKAALKSGLTPIVCIGETLQEREAEKTFEVIKRQIEGALKGYGSGDVQKMVVAYEPVWAIGTGRTATPQQAQEVHKFIREQLERLYDKNTAQAVRIQYGGSVKPDNIGELIAQPDIDGALVGGASLKADAFTDIVRAGAAVNQ